MSKFATVFNEKGQFSLSSVIKYQSTKELFFNAKLPAQKTTLQENVAAVVFTVDFDKV